MGEALGGVDIMEVRHTAWPLSEDLSVKELALSAMIGERVTSGGTIVEKVMVAEGGEARIEREQTLTSRIWEETCS